MFDCSRLKRLMAEQGLSQSELARRVGVSQGAIWKLLNEPAQGSKHMHRIAFELGTTAAYLMQETDDPKSEAPDFLYTSEERALIDLWREIDPRSRSALLQIARSLVSGQSSSVHAPQSEFRLG